ncbi:MAG: DUF3299 domain-containing protein [Pirellulaceae bacterium]
MSTSTRSAFEEGLDGDFQPYRTISKPAVISLTLGVLSLAAFMFPPLLVLPLVGFFSGLLGYRTIRRYPLEFSGKVPSIAGLVLCGICFVGGLAFHSAVYATEVPDGYTRITFDTLQPVREHPELPISPAAAELDGKRVFIKGYVYPDGQQHGIKRFVLVNDMGTCCFGGQPKLTHMIEVTLEDPLRVDYAIKKRKLAGVLEVDTRIKAVSGLSGVYFQLKADYLR